DAPTNKADVGNDFTNAVVAGMNTVAGSVDAYPVSTSCHIEMFESHKTGYNLKMSIYRALKIRKNVDLSWGALVGVRPVKLFSDALNRGVSTSAVIERVRDKYDISREKAKLCCDVAQREMEILAREAISTDDATLYVGVPFCKTRCLYCSFTSEAYNMASKYETLYLDALERELSFVAGSIGALGKRIRWIYIGGGTPTAISHGGFKRMLEFLSESFPAIDLREYTVEAGRPDTIDREKLDLICDYAGNTKRIRLCINPQSMNAETLRLIGRGHSPDEIVDAFHLARSMGIFEINMDIIAGLPGENERMFDHTLSELAKLSPDSFTVHTLAVKRASILNEKFDDFIYPETKVVAGMLQQAGLYAAESDMMPYYLYRQKNMLGKLENIGYAKEKRECVYNILEMADTVDVFAVGAGAVTKLVEHCSNKIERVYNPKNLREYITRIDEVIEKKKGMVISYG
ncbi:MAG: coproporphyrinogen dehydrogenase HemZ, partial [Oscillospiraceae bacterium]|nr:coproporphyrinogen dehydrogenase HemZ [Oscillospiraceae bacterium]